MVHRLSNVQGATSGHAGGILMLKAERPLRKCFLKIHNARDRATEEYIFRKISC